MGQAPSSNGGTPAAPAPQPQKKCYYELLAVERTATQDEIKKAYRKKALELHPDRNYNDVERATRLFAEVQTAYEVISDPQERAWYDSHRDAILGGHHHSQDEHQQHAPTGVTTAEDVLGWFSQFPAARGPLFFPTITRAFATLADEELKAAAWEGVDPIEYPAFGTARDTYETGGVREFYAAWTNFATVKTFAWCDLYRLSDAPDRRVRRAMEKENLKIREAARREFNDTVVSFVRFVRKRDPRYTPNTQTEAQRQAAILQRSREQAARQRAENAKRRGEYQAADWTRVDINSEEEYEDEEGREGEEGGSGEGEAAEQEEDESEEEEVVERYECVICRKVFRSQGQMDAHEKSKKHVKAVQQLKRQMMKENKEFNLDRDVRGKAFTKPVEEYTPIDDEDEMLAAEDDILDDMLNIVQNGGKDNDKGVLILQPTTTEEKPEPQEEEKPKPEKPEEDDEDDEYVSAEKFGARILGEGSDLDGISSGLASAALSDREDSKPAPKMGKAKAKRAKRAQKAAAEEEQAQASDFNCATCRQCFPSKTRLFTHLKENPGHAKLVPVAAAGGGGKKKKGKR